MGFFNSRCMAGCFIVMCIFSCEIYGYATQKRQKYSKQTLCDVQDKIERNCMRFVGHMRSTLECAAQCTKNTLSFGYSVNGTSCFNHFTCMSTSNNCVQESLDFRYYHKQVTSPCLHGGIWDAYLGSCECCDGWINQYCETRAKSCRELYDWGYPNGINIVYLDIPRSSKYWKVACFRDRQYIRTYVFAHTGGINFNRTWNEYKNGFFEEDSQHMPSFFIGLQPLYLLCKAGLKELVVSVVFPSNRGSSGAYQLMTDANFRDANHFYEINFKTVELTQFGNIASLLTQSDCMTPAKKSKFSTWDSYNSDGENQAVTSGTGWWFSSTESKCNYLGKQCRTLAEMGKSCVYVDGISRELFVDHLPHSRLYLREPI